MLLLLWGVILCNLVTLPNILGKGPPKKHFQYAYAKFQFATINETTTLKCPVQYSKPKVFVEWMKGNTSLYTEQGYQFTKDGHLKIKSVARQHSGVYTCEAINGFGSLKLNVTLIVDSPDTENQKNSTTHQNTSWKQSYPPTIEDRGDSADVAIGGSATFHCIVSGQPLPRVFWVRESQLVPNTSSYTVLGSVHSTLKLKDVRPSDGGSYSCVARNEKGQSEMVFNLRVAEPSPPPRIQSLEPSKISVPEGGSASFVCDVFSQQGTHVHIKWLKNHEEMGGTNLFRLENSFYQTLNLNFSVSRNGGLHKSKLLLQNVSPHDSGIYVCLAVNNFSYSYKNSSLVVIPTPTSFTSPVNSQNTSSTSLALVVTIGFVIILAVVVFVSHHYCSRQQGIESTSQNVDQEYHKSPIKTSVVGDLNSIPEIADPQSVTRLLHSPSSTVNSEYIEYRPTHPNFYSP